MKKKKKRKTKKTKWRKIGSVFLVLALVLIAVGLGVIFKLDSYYLKYTKENRNENISYKSIKKSLNTLESELSIKEVNYKWENSLTYDNRPNKIIVHHAAADNLTPEQIHNDHKNKDYDGIGYHYYIRKDGTIYRGRPEGAQGAHTIGENRKSLGVCLEGDFEKQKLTDKQKESLIKLCEYLIIKYNLEEIIGHRDAYNTLCPGKNISLDKINDDVGTRLIKLGQEYK
ncbi:MAG: peptidoglycan recognition protein family protein [Clostridium sp.]